jgi:hypothetical protein
LWSKFDKKNVEGPPGLGGLSFVRERTPVLAFADTLLDNHTPSGQQIVGSVLELPRMLGCGVIIGSNKPIGGNKMPVKSDDVGSVFSLAGLNPDWITNYWWTVIVARKTMNHDPKM